jgi:hypothetical protein
LPPAAAQARREPRATPRRDTRPGQRQDGRWDTPARGSAAEARGTSARGGQSQPRSGSRLAVVAVVALVAIVGLSAAAAKLLHSPAPSHARGHHSSSTGHTAKSAPLQPIAAEGFDALRTSAQDPTDENSSLAINLIDHNPSGWQTQQYYGSSNFGNLKSGSGLLLDMGKAVRVTSVLIKFGSQPGANVEIKVGDSDVRSAANEESMTTVASANDVFGSHMFTIAKPVTDRYLVVWFTNLPPLAHAQGKYMAQIFTIIVSGTG